MPTPTNQPISGLPANPGVSPTDKIEVLDVSNTTNQPTGENTQSTIAGLVAGLPAMGASGSGHAAGLVPDPGGTAGTTNFLCEDGTFKVPAGGTGGGLTAPVLINQGGTGQVTAPLAINALLPSQSSANGQVLGSNGTVAGWVTPPGGGLGAIADQRLLANISGSAAVPGATSHPAWLDAIYGTVRGTLGFFRGATLWQALAPGQPWQGLRSGGAGADPAWGNPRTPLFTVTGAGNNNTGTTATSAFTAATIGLGSLTVPANRFQLGSVLGLMLWGDYDAAAGTPTLTFTLTIGGVTVLTGVSSGMGTATGKMWFTTGPFYLGVQAVGAGGKIAGWGALTGLGTSSTGVFGVYLTTGGSGNASTPVTIDTTLALPIDFTTQWSAGSNRFRLLGGSAWIDG